MQAAAFNRREDAKDCCGMLRPGLVLAGIAGQSVKNLPIERVSHMLKVSFGVEFLLHCSSLLD